MKLTDSQILEMLEDDGDSFHDCLMDSLGLTYQLNTAHLVMLFKELPFEMQTIAFAFGLSDTPFRDDTYAFCKKHSIDLVSKLVRMGENPQLEKSSTDLIKDQIHELIKIGATLERNSPKLSTQLAAISKNILDVVDDIN